MAVIFPNPITINVTDLNGMPLSPRYFGGEVHYHFNDNPISRIVKGKINQTDLPFILWSGHDYDMAGDYTQIDIEQKISSLLSGDAAGFIASLFTGVNATGINQIANSTTEV
jgi:hypothetical protein